MYFSRQGPRWGSIRSQRGGHSGFMFAVILLISSLLHFSHAAAVVPRQSGMKVMIVGDSISCGGEGDFTWRYFIWQWFRDNGIAATFVGPRTGTATPAKVEQPRPPLIAGETDNRPTTGGFEGGYDASCDASFKSSVKHLTQWGWQVAQAKNSIRQEVANFMPDMILVELGFNDLGWYISGAQGTLDSMKSFVDEARRANPNVKMVIANVLQRPYLGFGDLPQKTADYNNMLVDAVPTWSTAQSPIYVADYEGEITCNTRDCPAAYDSLHPNKLGDLQIARAFSIALYRGHKLGRGPFTLPANTAEAVPAVPSNVRQVPWDGGIRVEWNAVPGARFYEIEDCWPGGPCAVGASNTPALFLNWVFDGMQKEYRIRAVKSTPQNVKSDWSAKITATARPKVAAPPKNIQVFPEGSGYRVTWDPPDGGYSINRYSLLTWDSDLTSSFFQGMAVGGSARSLYFPTEFPGHNFLVAMISWTDSPSGPLGGLPGIARHVIPNGGVPATPQNPRIVTYNGGGSMRMRADNDDRASGYQYRIRRVDANGNPIDGNGNPANPDGENAGTSYGPCITGHFLFPGAWNYQWRMMAYNGQRESGWTSWIQAPNTITEGDSECPPDPTFTLGGGGAPTPDTPESRPPSYTSPGTGTGTGTGTSPSTSPGGGNQCSVAGNQPVRSSVYNSVSAGTELQSYQQSFNKDRKMFITDYAESYGLGRNIYSCGIREDVCGPITCSDMGTKQNEAGSAAAYAILTSASNLNEFHRKMYGALETAFSNASSLQITFTENFPELKDGNPGRESDFSIATIFAALGGMLATAGSFASPAGAAAFNGIAGLLGTIGSTIKMEQQTLKAIAENQQALSSFLTRTLESIETSNTAFLKSAEYQGTKLSDVFKDGSWYDRSQYPLLTGDIRDGTGFTNYIKNLNTLLVAQLAMKRWDEEVAYIYSYPMTEQQYKDHDWSEHIGQRDLHIWRNGRGYFVQSNNHFPRKGFTTRYPTGWDKLSSMGFSWTDVIISSNRSYERHGWVWEDTAEDMKQILTGEKVTPQSMLQLPGIFRMPVCNIEPNQLTFDEFAVSIRSPETIGPGMNFNNADFGFCWCREKTQAGTTMRQSKLWKTITKYSTEGGVCRGQKQN